MDPLNHASSGLSGEADYVTKLANQDTSINANTQPTRSSQTTPPAGRDSDKGYEDISQISELFQTPVETIRDMRESTPATKTVCTGEKLDEFFRQYTNHDNIYNAIQQPSIPKPNISPPPSPSELSAVNSCADDDSIPSPTYSTITQKGEDSLATDFAGLGTECAPTVPVSYSESERDKHAAEWRKVIDNELDAHKTNNTWMVVPLPDDKKLLSTKWVFTVKYDALGNLDCFKARLVARGFEQRAGIDFDETYAPVAHTNSVRVMLALCALKNWSMSQFDISTAFLNGTIEEDIYLKPPEGLQTESGHCLKLNKALYGLKQAPRAWNSKFDATLIELGFNPTVSNKCVYVNKDGPSYILVYVDDGLVFAPTEERCAKIINRLAQAFNLKRLSGNSFLGIAIERKEGTISTGQKHYVNIMLERFNMADCKSVSNPIIDTAHLSTCKGEPLDENTPYLAAIGALNYLACRTRPDILLQWRFFQGLAASPNKNTGVR